MTRADATALTGSARGRRLAPLTPHRRDWEAYAGAAAIALLVFVAYHNSFHVPLIFDDFQAIAGNAHVRTLWPPWVAMTSPPEFVTAGRPVLSLSVAVNYAMSGMDVWSYHLGNFIIHLLGSITLFGVARRTLAREPLRQRLGGAATGLALVIAMVWAVHPLQIMAVTYISQRAESLMGFFYLLTLYCALRGFDAQKPARWYAAAVVACALGMGSKEVMASAPLMVLIYDTLFVARSFRRALHDRRGLYAGLAATWIIFGFIVYTGPRSGSVGWGFPELTALDYARTQSHVLVHYLRLSLWPYPLVFDYHWPIVTRFTDCLWQGSVIVALLLLTLWAVLGRRRMAFLGVWFFVILAPSSSFLPILTEIACEYRMYLSLAAVVTLIVVGGYLGLQALGRRRLLTPYAARVTGIVLAAGVIALLAGMTWRRNIDYQSDLSLWQDTVAKAPRNPRAINNLGVEYMSRGRVDEAIAQYTKALALSPTYPEAHNNLGNALREKRRFAEAQVEYRRALESKPEFPMAHNNLGSLLLEMGSTRKAIDEFEEAVRLSPDYVDGCSNLAWVLATHKPGQGGDPQRALELAQRITRLTNRADADCLDALAAALAANGRFREAESTAGEAFAIAENDGRHRLADGIRTRISLYHAGLPCLERSHEVSKDKDRR